jgi:PAS domain S-box-containing protein
MLIGNLPGMVCRFKNDIDWTMEYMSEGCLELTGYEPKELIGNRCISYGKITMEEDNLRAWEVIQTAIKLESKYQLEYRIITKEGQEKWIWEQGAAIYSAKKQVLAIEAFMTDITSQKKAELEHQRLIKELRERNMELDTFVYRISHDIRSPLLTMYGLSALMRVETSMEEMPEYCDKIDETVRKLEYFTKELLVYTRSKEREEVVSKIDFRTLINDAMEDSGFPFYTAFINLEAHIHLKNEVYSEVFRLKAILGNLFSNAIKYRDRSKSNCLVKVTVSSEPNHFTIEVEDNGIGINPKFKEDVFKMFFRAAEISEGSGLGLYIAKMNVEKLQGTIGFKDTQGGGTTFLLSFPMVERNVV